MICFKEKKFLAARSHRVLAVDIVIDLVTLRTRDNVLTLADFWQPYRPFFRQPAGFENEANAY